MIKYKNKLSLFFLFNCFIFLISLQNVILTNNFYVLIFSVCSFILLIYKEYKNWKYILIFSIVGMIVFFCSYYLTEYSFKSFYLFVKSNLNNLDLRTNGINYLKHIYNQNIANTLNLMIFNQKDYSNEIYKSIININIISLFVISGLHVNILVGCINFIFRWNKNKWINIIKELLNISIISFLFYLTGFSISILRVLLTYIIKSFNKKINNLNATYLSGILIWFISPKDSISYSFILSYLCVINIWYINKLFYKHPFLKLFIIPIWLNLITLPIIVNFNNSFNILSVFFNIIFSPLIIFIYIFSLCFCWIKQMNIIINFLINSTNYLIINIFNQNQLIKLNVNYLISIIIYFLWFNLINWLTIKIPSDITQKECTNYKPCSVLKIKR